MKKFLFIVLSILLLSCEHPESAEYSRNKGKTGSTNNSSHQNGYKVIGVKDGDTVVLLLDGKEQTVRLAHIDCPEKNQPFGKKAKQFASDLCFEKYVTLNHKNKLDRNQRLIAEIILDNGQNLNKELVRAGLAWHFKKYSKEIEYSELENEARETKIGLWSEPNPIAPWDWRK